MRYYLDTEFSESGRSIDLISIGVVAEDGREYYAESSEFDWDYATDWLRDNVFPHMNLVLHQRTRRDVRDELLDFCNPGVYGKPSFWGYYAAYDWVVVCKLFGNMIRVPDNWPKYCMDVKQWAMQLGNPQLPQQTSTKHHALEDARWVKTAWEHLLVLETQLAAAGRLPSGGR